MFRCMDATSTIRAAEGDLKPSQGSKKKQTLEDVLDKFLHSTHSCHPGKAVKVDILGSYDRLDVH
jgi:hypothetical protein